MVMQHRTKLGIAGAAALILAACGGGGGGGGGGGSSSGVDFTKPSTSGATVDSTNGDMISKTSYDSMESLFIDSGFNDLTSSTAADVSGGSSPGLLARINGLVADGVQKADFAGPDAVTGVTQNQSYACDGGGSITVSSTDANDNGAIDSGDSFSISADNCVDSTGARTDGSFAFDVTAWNYGGTDASIVGDTYATNDWDYAVTLTFNRFVTEDPSGVVEGIDGSFTFSASFDSMATDLTIGLDGELLSVSSVEPSSYVSSLSISVTLTDPNTQPNLYTNGTYTASFASSAIGGAVTVSTPIPFENQSSSAIYPEVGTLKVQSPGGSSYAKLNADTTNEQTVYLTIDTGGGPSTSEKNWTDL